MSILEKYLKSLKSIRATGGNQPETSFYPPLSNLLNEIGDSLKPKVRCIMNMANQGAGMPDGGLYTADQVPSVSDDPLPRQIPARGVLEAKPPCDNVADIAESEQVKRYCTRYELVLVTNFREFQLVGRASDGRPGLLEQFSLAADEQSFWNTVEHPRAAAKERGEQFEEFLKRVLLHNAPLTEPKDVAWFLASYARDAKIRVENRHDLSALAAVREALENALGMKFTGRQGEHFFRSTLVQTLFYGVFSSWVLWHRDPGRTERFNWHEAGWYLQVPFIRTLYHQVASPDRLGPLGLVEVLNWTASVLNRVNRAIFFRKFRDEHAVQYFYEPFLEAFDPELRKQLGVWYTPPEIVKYQVARVDAVLREELGLADGLADPDVVVLDPCCGTGAYLVEVLHKIAETLKAKGGDALTASDLKKAAMERVFGFEILPAPFVVAHLQLGLVLQQFGVPLIADSNERAGVYLTNALTGWEPPEEPQTLLFPELEAERDAAERVKQTSRILVVLGNPPYNAFAGVSPEEEQGLVDPYKKNLNVPVKEGGWGIKKFNLDDLYVRFFRLAERRIAEMTGKGVVSYISNFSYLGNPSFVVMRQRLLAEFDKLWFDCMNGDSRETGKQTPDGKPDPSVFSTEHNREGIRVGTAISVIVRKEKRNEKPEVRFRHFWGKKKRDDLLDSLQADDFDDEYESAEPIIGNRFSFVPEDVSDHYNTWPKIPDFARAHYNGPVERRGGALISIDRGPLEYRMRAYFDELIPDAEIKQLYDSLMMTGNRIVGPDARRKILSEHKFDSNCITRYPFKVFDTRWSYLHNLRPLFSEPSPQLLSERIPGNAFLVTRDTADKVPEGPPFYLSSLVCDYDCISGHARHFPFLTVSPAKVKNEKQTTLFEHAPAPNLSKGVSEYFASLNIEHPDCISVASSIWMHVLAIGYSPEYLTENADGIRRDWPRIPLPDDRKMLEDSAELGRQVAAMLDTEAGVPGITAGAIEDIYRICGCIQKIDGGAVNPDSGDLAVTAGWGHDGGRGITMPGKGHLEERDYEQVELEAIAAAAAERGLSTGQALELLGEHTYDIYLNDAVYWKNVPLNVWNYYIGGYQVIKKWLSYREEKLLGRPLKVEEAREVTNMVRRLTAIVLMQPKLDENYRRVKENTYPWPKNV